MWKHYYENLYCTKSNSKCRCIFESKLINGSSESNKLLFTVQDIISAVHNQKHGEAAGPDSLQMEAFIYGCHRVFVYLTILFNLYVKCGYVPSDFCKAVIISLVKNKNGNFADVND